MNRRLGASIAFVAATSAVLFVCAVTQPLDLDVSITRHPDGLVAGLIFWTVLTAAGSSLSVRMPGGGSVDVTLAPVVAGMSVGGPAVAAIAGLFGSTQARELKGQVPWYGVVANHGTIMAPAIISALLLQSVPSRSVPLVDFVATVAAASVCFTVNILMTSAFLSLRDGVSVTGQIRSAAGAYISLLALAPVAWLMAQMYVTAGFWAVLLFAVPLYTTRLAYRRFVEVREMFTQTVRSLAEAVDKRDKFTSGHSHRVQTIAMDIGRVMKVSDADMEILEWGGLLHDIGKIGVPDSVLLKQDKLTREERIVMNAHPVLGAEIIAPVTHLAPELPIIRHHHEWFNGSGYPDRLVGDKIPKLARILHVADAFEAMTAPRPYRMTPLTTEEAIAELHRFAGVQFDPEMVDAFLRTSWAQVEPTPFPEPIRLVPLIGHAAAAMAAVDETAGTA
jgi:putative nucleotidyltransferase with HDIG domain